MGSIDGYVFTTYASGSVTLFTSVLSLSCLYIHTGVEIPLTCTYISMFMVLSR